MSRYPWSAIGKLYNETGASCSGVVVARGKILTAAHCIFNARTRRFIPASALHFLVGYQMGRYAVHARIAHYEIGSGFDPLRYHETSNADWAILTTTENLPANIEPLKLSPDTASSGTKAITVGYPQERAFAMTADRHCELRERIDGGRLLLHTCRAAKGYSGAPLLVGAGGNEVKVAGIQISTFRAGAVQQSIAVPAQAIWRQIEPRPTVTAEMPAATSTPAPDDDARCILGAAGVDLASAAGKPTAVREDRVQIAEMFSFVF